MTASPAGGRCDGQRPPVEDGVDLRCAPGPVRLRVGGRRSLGQPRSQSHCAPSRRRSSSGARSSRAARRTCADSAEASCSKTMSGFRASRHSTCASRRPRERARFQLDQAQRHDRSPRPRPSPAWCSRRRGRRMRSTSVRDHAPAGRRVSPLTRPGSPARPAQRAPIRSTPRQRGPRQRVEHRRERERHRRPRGRPPRSAASSPRAGRATGSELSYGRDHRGRLVGLGRLPRARRGEPQLARTRELAARARPGACHPVEPALSLPGWVGNEASVLVQAGAALLVALGAYLLVRAAWALWEVRALAAFYRDVPGRHPPARSTPFRSSSRGAFP